MKLPVKASSKAYPTIESMGARYMRPCEAARLWKCSYRSVSRWMNANPRLVVQVVITSSTPLRYMRVIPRDIPTPIFRVGCPLMHDSSWQREQAYKRHR